MNENIHYRTDEIARYFSSNRVKWQQFYDSERFIIEQLNLNSEHHVLDIGCGCGGLGLALRDKFRIKHYTGVEINTSAASVAQVMNAQANIYCGDILKLKQSSLKNKLFDVVFSLSCIDWNAEFSAMLTAALDFARPKGYLIATFRLTLEKGCDDMARSYQFINYNGMLEGEKAPYVVVNAEELFWEISRRNPLKICAYGYWGQPSLTAVTPYDKLCFVAIAIQIRSPEDATSTKYQLHLPQEILTCVARTRQ